MTMQEWENELRELSPEVRQEMKTHLLGLKDIVYFYDKFAWTHMFMLITIIDSMDR